MTTQNLNLEPTLGTADAVVPSMETASLIDRISRDSRLDNHFAQARLGLASSLFLALRAKHPPTAAHGLRVALICSTWAHHTELDETVRNSLEIAALLHDIGKIGVPDAVLMKPARLDADEAELIKQHRTHGLNILKASCCSEDVLRIVEYAPARYRASVTDPFDLSGEDLPWGARVVAIADAYDSMLTEQVYRPAMAQEAAIAELFAQSNSQFDPALVRNFAQLQQVGKLLLSQDVINRWLSDLNSTSSPRIWDTRPLEPTVPLDGHSMLFHDKLLDHTPHGIVYVDPSGRILQWNAGAERITGLRAESVVDHQWDANCLRLWDEDGCRLTEEYCPVRYAIDSKCRYQQRVMLRRADRDLDLDLRVVPILDETGICHGAALILADATSETSLRQTVRDLHDRATRDPLTKAANRAEFDRVLAYHVKEFSEKGSPSSLVICDLDHFKSVNDEFGHPAGDAVLIRFANLLQSACRPDDLVARYGGEEFAILCWDCDNAAATIRAEDIRLRLTQIAFEELKGKSVTASLGVTQVQSGDTSETVLRRADRALYMAKDGGRNRVVQLGSGDDRSVEISRFPSIWSNWFSARPDGAVLQRNLLARVPVNIVMEKIRGFVSDHSAEILALDEEHALISIDGRLVTSHRRRSDRPSTMLMELQFHKLAELPRGWPTATRIKVAIRPKRKRDRRSDGAERAQRLLVSLRAYLMASDEESV